MLSRILYLLGYVLLLSSIVTPEEVCSDDEPIPEFYHYLNLVRSLNELKSYSEYKPTVRLELEIKINAAYIPWTEEDTYRVWYENDCLVHGECCHPHWHGDKACIRWREQKHLKEYAMREMERISQQIHQIHQIHPCPVWTKDLSRDLNAYEAIIWAISEDYPFFIVMIVVTLILAYCI